MRFEFSAGGIVYKNQKSIPIQSGSKIKKNKVLILVSQHSQHHGWVFPKGLIGDHPSTNSGQAETKEEAAVREVKEETGIEAKIVEELPPVTYWYIFEGEKIKKTVYYYIMEHIGGNFEDRDFEMEDVEWLSPDEVEKRLTYKSDKEVWEKARKIIDRLVTGI